MANKRYSRIITSGFSGKRVVVSDRAFTVITVIFENGSKRKFNYKYINSNLRWKAFHSSEKNPKRTYFYKDSTGHYVKFKAGKTIYQSFY